eukprot:CAMPEP_0204527514 /NCGR_PEP_ID=MMETSP0661-20131031/9025_1 /ASSEMBLY_ACC=CAM_ASM_000606 /TAXON_ID=109239 /ORGANISM="Alexandrium margalefi, Strain AMGDE01CS-322" /LENGTH=147 /DNA_ID=CAMNT_0051533431 /DNA_START=43 /DNA_END=486 /DNA_ORIENTATION=+
MPAGRPACVRACLSLPAGWRAQPYFKRYLRSLPPSRLRRYFQRRSSLPVLIAFKGTTTPSTCGSSRGRRQRAGRRRGSARPPPRGASGTKGCSSRTRGTGSKSFGPAAAAGSEAAQALAAEILPTPCRAARRAAATANCMLRGAWPG